MTGRRTSHQNAKSAAEHYLRRQPAERPDLLRSYVRPSLERTVKRVGLVLWAVLLLCFALSTVASAVSSRPVAIAIATCVFVGFPPLAVSAAAIWTACFLHPRPPRS